MSKEANLFDDFSTKVLQLIQDLDEAKSCIARLESMLEEQKILNEKYKHTIEKQTQVISELSSQKVLNNDIRKEKEVLKKQIQEYILSIDESIQWFTNNPFPIYRNNENKS